MSADAPVDRQSYRRHHSVPSWPCCISYARVMYLYTRDFDEMRSVKGKTLCVIHVCTVRYISSMSFRLALSIESKARGEMSLWCLPQELRDLIYDHLRDELDPAQTNPASTVIQIFPKIPADLLLVSQGMRDDVQRWWRSLSRIVIAGRGDQCVHALSSLQRTEPVAMQARAIRVSLAYDCASGASTADIAPNDHLHHHLAVQMEQVHQLCRGMLHLRTIWLQVTTPPTRASPTDMHAHIARSLKATLRVETVSCGYDRWYQAIRTDAHFLWLGRQGMDCSGRLVHLAMSTKVC